MQTPILENQRVKLSLLDLSNYKQLITIAQEDKLVQYSPCEIATSEQLKRYVRTAVDGFYHKTAIPFIIYDKKRQAFAGSTRFGLINWDHKVLHIGWTWIGREFQGTGLNEHMKFLMLSYAFEELLFEKVEFRIDERNKRSRMAIEKIGGTLEGILKKDTLMMDGFRRSTCCYGILKEDWSTIKTKYFSNLTN